MAAQSAWKKMSLKKDGLLPYISRRMIPKKMEKNRWRVPTMETYPLPLPGEFVIFTSFLDWGLAIPTSRFLRQFLNFYSIKLSDLGPHSMQQIAFFVTLCEGWLGCPAYFPLWLAMFHGRAQRTSDDDGGELIASGGITFQMQGGKLAEDAFIKVELPNKAKNSWRRDWLYFREETLTGELAVPQFSMEPSRPRQIGRAHV